MRVQCCTVVLESSSSKFVRVSSAADLYGQSLKVQSPRISYSAESFKHCYAQDLKGIEHQNHLVQKIGESFKSCHLQTQFGRAKSPRNTYRKLVSKQCHNMRGIHIKTAWLNRLLELVSLQKKHLNIQLPTLQKHQLLLSLSGLPFNGCQCRNQLYIL